MKIRMRSMLGLAGTVVLLLSLLATPAAGQAATPAATPAANGKIAYYAFVGGNAEIFVADPDGSNPTNLTNHPADDVSPVWSPDGTRIAFASVRDSSVWEIYVMNADGSNVVRLTNNQVNDMSPTWSPDGSQIAYTSSPDGRWWLYAMNADGSNQRVLAEPSAQWPAWSPDGSRIAFTGLVPAVNSEIFVMDADGSDQVNLTNSMREDMSPAWSPDGARIAFESTGEQSKDIFVMNADGSGLTNLTTNALVDRSPAWSPDGLQIVFSSFRNGGDAGLYVMNADGTNERSLGLSGYVPDWQPLAGAALDCSRAFASQPLLWPANHKYVPIQIEGVTGPAGAAATIIVTSIFQDEAVDARGSGNTSPDATGVGGPIAQVRAERMGPGDGRVYHIGFTATSAQGATCSGEITVGVPKNGNQQQPGDGGALYDSTATAAPGAEQGRDGGDGKQGGSGKQGEDDAKGNKNDKNDKDNKDKKNDKDNKGNKGNNGKGK